MSKDKLGDRMKGYENISRNYLTKRLPVIIRIDGKAFHTFTKGFKKPFDEILINTMQQTAQYLCENIQGCKIAYTQSDEITLLLTDYDALETQGWFNYNIQKMCSISSSMATLSFNKFFHRNVESYMVDKAKEMSENYKIGEELIKFKEIYERKYDRALFDSRVFTIPKEEVCNCFIWRQQDAIRNSIEMVGRTYFSNNELFKRNCEEIKQMLLLDKDVSWGAIDVHLQRGSCVIKEKYYKNGVERNRWIIDKNIPIFSHDRDYIDKYVFI